MKGYKDYMNARTVDPLLHDKIMQSVMKNPKPVCQKQHIMQYVVAAACLVLVVFTGTFAFRNLNLSNGHYGIWSNEKLQVAYMYDYLDIFYVTEQGVISFESVMLRFTPQDVFEKWAELNDVRDVSVVRSLLDREMTHFQHGDPSSPDSVVGVIMGDYAVFQLTLSNEFAPYMYSDRGHLLMKSLKMTFYHYFDLGEVDLFIDITNETQQSELQFFIYALNFNDIQNEMSASRVMPDFAHDLTDEQFNAIFPTLDRTRFEATAWFWLARGEYFSGLIEVSAHDQNGQASVTAVEGVTSFIDPISKPTDLQISYVHGIEVTAIMSEAYPLYAVRAEFVLGNIGYNVRYFDYDREVAKEQLTALVNQIIYGGAPDWSVLADPVVPELRNEEMTFEQARTDPDFGAFMPVTIPQNFVFDSGRRTLNQWDNSIRANWHRFPTFDNIFWTVTEPHEFDRERIVSVNDRHKFDVSLYSIPWMDSVPSEIIDYLRSPVFFAEEMSLEIVQARAQWGEAGHGESAGWHIMSFGVLYGDVLIRISANGVSPEQVWAMLP